MNTCKTDMPEDIKFLRRDEGIKSIRIHELNINARGYNVLRANDIMDVRECQYLTIYDLYRIRGCGKSTVNDIVVALKQIGIIIAYSDFARISGRIEYRFYNFTYRIDKWFPDGYKHDRSRHELCIQRSRINDAPIGIWYKKK